MQGYRLQKIGVQIWAFAFKNWIVTKRNAFSLFEILFWPVVGFFSVGLLTRFLNLDADLSGYILIGIISMSVIQVCQIDIAYVLLYDLWSKSLKHTFIAPVRAFQLVLGSWIIGILRSLFVFLFLSVMSHVAFGFNFFKPGAGALALFLLGLCLLAMTLGIMVCILVLLFGYKADVAAWSFSYLLALICGIYYPVSILPAPLPAIAKAVPLTYFLEFFRTYYGAAGGGPVLKGPALLGWGFGLAGVYLVVEAFLFRAVLQRARRIGTLNKLSE